MNSCGLKICISPIPITTQKPCSHRRSRYTPHARRLICPQAVQSSIAPGSLAENVRPDFPVLGRTVNGKPLIYLDSAASSQKPKSVLEAMDNYYRNSHSNVHRGAHTLSAEATTLFENARSKLAAFISAPSDQEVVFTRNATEAINLVAFGWGLKHLKMGDEIIVSVAEHHSNLVPWHIICKKTGAELKYIGLTKETEELDVEDLDNLLTDRTKLVSMLCVSNVLGSTTPIEEVAAKAHKFGAKLLVDCCQAMPHIPVNVQQMGADWIVGSGHKMCGPTGIGFLWGKYNTLLEMEPYMGGGNMISDVYLDRFTYADPPARFEAGTPSIAETIGLGAACDYLSGIGMENVHTYEKEIGRYLYEKLAAIDGVRIYGPPSSHGHGALCSFNVDGIHAADLAMILDQYGVAIRTGHHCCQPLHRYFNINSSARASLYIYNTKAEIDVFCDAMLESIQFFS